MPSLALFFRVIYRTFYGFLHVLLIALLVVSPADIINQARVRGNLYPILIVAICYVFSILFVIFVYCTRLYVNQSVLRSIPKPWIPVEKGDVRKNVRKIIAASLSRSATIAFASRPHIAPPPMPGSMGGQAEQKPDEHDEPGRTSFQLLGLGKAATVEEDMGIRLPPHKPVWGKIEHFGWASPESADLANLQYGTVIPELPNLIEAKALTLAPPDPASHTDPPMLDPEAVALLQRPLSMSLRDYLAHLADLGVLTTTPPVADFVAMYEYARFSTRMISNVRFRELMHNFADILRNMQPLDSTMLEGSDGGNSAASESDIDNDAPMGSEPTTPRSQRSQLGDISSSPGSDSGASQVRRRPRLAARNSSANTGQQYRTAPTTPKSRVTAVSRRSLSRSSSANSFAQTRHPYAASQPSTSSLRSASSGGSVIRLSERHDSSELPYVLGIIDTA